MDNLPRVELTTHGVAKGGNAVAREESGRVVFVEGALPGERVLVELIPSNDKKNFGRGRVVEVLDPSPHRVEPSCPEVDKGCGGCDFQMVAVDEQLRLKETVVRDALERVGRQDISRLDIKTVALPARGYRTTVRCLVVGGIASFRARQSNDGVPVANCEVAHPLIQTMIAEGRFGTGISAPKEVTIRVGAATGDQMVYVSPGIAPDTSLPGDDNVVLIGADDIKAGRRAWIHEEVAGRTWRISAQSFFQARPDGAEALVAAVREAVGELQPGARAFDLYGGVGLFAGTVFPDGCRVTLVEQNPSSIADARVNVEQDPKLDVRIVKSKVESWTPKRADVVVADPARQGLGRVAVSKITETDAPTIVLVSCDAASLARDADLLGRRGYQLETLTLVDLFPMTSHTETVARFVAS